MARQGADGQTVVLRRGPQISLVIGHHIGNFFLHKQCNNLLVDCRFSHRAVHHQNGAVHPVQRPFCLLDPQFSQLALVVKARRIDDDHRPHGQQLHGLLDRVGGGALDLGHHRQLLTGHGVDQTGFSGVSPAEKSDVDPLGGGRVVHTHMLPQNRKSRMPCSIFCRWSAQISRTLSLGMFWSSA